MLRVGFVGSGLIAWAHGLSLKAMIDGGVVEASIVAVHDQRERRARGFADAVGADGVDVVADAAEVARRCDAIWVCTPTSAHRGAVDEALAAGLRRVLREAARRGPGPRHRAGRGGRRRPASPARAASSCAARRSSGRCATWCRAGRWVRRWRRSSATTSTSPFRAPTPRSGGPTSPRPAGAA